MKRIRWGKKFNKNDAPYRYNNGKQWISVQPGGKFQDVSDLDARRMQTIFPFLEVEEARNVEIKQEVKEEVKVTTTSTDIKVEVKPDTKKEEKEKQELAEKIKKQYGVKKTNKK